MPLADFVHLRVHTAYSLSAGAITIKELVALLQGRAHAGGGDHRQRQSVRRARIRHRLRRRRGAADHRLRDRARAATRTAAATARWARPIAEPDRIVLLVQNEAGYRNLLALVSRVLSRRRRPAPSRRWRSPTSPRASDGLICLTGGPKGPVGRLLAEGQGEAAEAVLGELTAAFPGRLYIELMRHGVPRGGAQRAGARSISPIATICRSSPPTTPISPTAISTRRTTR